MERTLKINIDVIKCPKRNAKHRFYDISIFLKISKNENFKKIGGWGVLKREIVSFRSCVRTRGLVA